MEFDMKRIRTIGCRAAGMGMLLAALAGALLSRARRVPAA